MQLEARLGVGVELCVAVWTGNPYHTDRVG